MQDGLLRKSSVDQEIKKEVELLLSALPGARGISDNSKLVKAGEIFVLMPSFGRGDAQVVRAEEYIKEALAKGALKAIIPESYVGSGVSESFVEKNDSKIVKVADNKFISYVASLCSTYYNNLPKHLFGVTGTNGKTSTVDFIRQLLSNKLHKKAASIGTMGVMLQRDGEASGEILDMSEEGYEGRTTASLISNYRILSKLRSEFDVDFVAMELSSHGLDQERISGLRFDSISFTSFSRDHLDYHKSIDEYFAAKMKILSHANKIFVCEDGVDERLINKMRLKAPMGVKIISYNKAVYEKALGDDLYDPSFLLMMDEKSGAKRLIGDFQLLNATAAALQVASSFGLEKEKLLKLLPSLSPVAGRMEVVAKYKNTVFVVDYAHSPDGIEKALHALLPYKTQRGKLAIVFGAGGERDREKRPLMGAVAAKGADIVVVTDDNPRRENPAQIRAEILSGIDEFIESGVISANFVDAEPDRQRAIEKALLKINTNDEEELNIILVAGKGHESTQVYADRVEEYNDVSAIERVIAKLCSIWSLDEIIDVISPISINSVGRERKALKAISNIVIDSRKAKTGSLFIAIKGDKNDGHDYIEEAFKNGANFAIIDNPVHAGKPGTILVKDAFLSLQSIGTMGRKRLLDDARVVGITGSFGKTSTKEMLSIVIADQVGKDKVYKNEGSLNNHYGVPLTLANMPKDTKVAIIEMGMNRPGEIKQHTYMVKPHVALITTVGLAHTANFSSINDIALAKAEIFYSNSPIAVINKDLSVYAVLDLKARQHNAKAIITFSSHKTMTADIKASDIKMDHTGTSATITGLIPLHLKVVGMQWIQNALGVLGVVKALKLDMKKACKSLEKFEPVSGRGKIYRNEKKDITIIDESYNAQPLAMITAIQNLEYYKSRRTVAVLGDMYDLGNMTKKAHIDLADEIIKSKINVLYLCGPHMYDLYKELEEKNHQVKVYHTNTPDEAFNMIKNNIIPGDLYMVKGSRGDGKEPRMFKIVKGLINL